MKCFEAAIEGLREREEMLWWYPPGKYVHAGVIVVVIVVVEFASHKSFELEFVSESMEDFRLEDGPRHVMTWIGDEFETQAEERT